MIKYIYLLMLFMISASSFANTIIYNFDDNSIPSGVFAQNAELSANNQCLEMNVGPMNSSWSAKLIVVVDSDIKQHPYVRFRYKPLNVSTDKIIGIAVTVKAEGVESQYSASELNGREEYQLDASESLWQTFEISIENLIKAWEAQNTTLTYDKIDQIRITVGTGGEKSYSGELLWDEIEVGDYVRAEAVEVSAENLKQVNVKLSTNVEGTINPECFSAVLTGEPISVQQAEIVSGNMITLTLPYEITIGEMAPDRPELFIIYDGSCQINKVGAINTLPAFNKQAGIQDYLQGFYPFWGEFRKYNDPIAQKWIPEESTTPGWDWSLPDIAIAHPMATIKYGDNTKPNLNYPAKNICSITADWSELEPTEGNYDFESLKAEIISKVSTGEYDGVFLAINTSVWDVKGWPDPNELPFDVGGRAVPDWLRIKYPTIEIISMPPNETGFFQVFNIDIMNPDYHKEYLEFVQALGNSGIPQLSELTLCRLGYRSASIGEEFTEYDSGDSNLDNRKNSDSFEQNYTLSEISTRTKERLSTWANAFGSDAGKLLWAHDVNDDAPRDYLNYAASLGLGNRSGIIEIYQRLMHHPELGISIDENRYMTIDEENHFIKNNAAFGDENEEYHNEYRFGWRESFQYRYLLSTLRMLQMRRNFVYHDRTTLNPELCWYMGLELGHNVTSTPDAWSLLFETYLSEWDNKGNKGAAKNIERWLYQRDRPGYETTPCLKVPSPKVYWCTDNQKPYEYTARKGKQMGFAVDDRLFPKGQQAMAFKITYYDGLTGQLKLLFNNNNGTQQRIIETTGTDQVKTATLFVDARLDAKGMNFDFELLSEEEVPILFVRLIKTQESYQEEQIHKSVTAINIIGETVIESNKGSIVLNASVLPADATIPNVTWEIIEGNEFAKVDLTGKVTALGRGNGTVKVRATAVDGSNIFATHHITLSNQDNVVIPQHIQIIYKALQPVINIKDGILQLAVDVFPDNCLDKSYVLEVLEGGDVATLSGNTLIATGTKNGKVKILARSTAFDISDTLLVTVYNQTVNVSHFEISTVNGSNTIWTNMEQLQMMATILPEEARHEKVIWSLDGVNWENIASIDENGLLSALGNDNGTVTVSAYLQDYPDFSDTYDIRVKNQVSTSINDKESDIEEVEIFPNPFDSSITIKVNNRCPFKIINIYGQEIYKSREDQVEVNIPTSDWKSGLYVFTNSNGFSKKIIKY